MKKFLILTLSLILFAVCQNTFADTNSKDTTPEPYKEDEFSQGLKDLRRFEIITLGSMPFITLDCAIVYNGYKYATGQTQTFNPLATADYSQQEMERIIITSLCISAGIGISDYVINLIKRNRVNKKKSRETSTIKIEEDPDAIRIPLPESSQNQTGETE